MSKQPMNYNSEWTQASLIVREKVKGFAKTTVAGGVGISDDLSQRMLTDLSGLPRDAAIGIVDVTGVLAFDAAAAGFTNVTFIYDQSIKLSQEEKGLYEPLFRLFDRAEIKAFDIMSDETPQFDVIIGNPPYGNGSKLLVRFLNRAFDLTDDVRFVLGRSIRKDSVMNRIRMDIECVSDETLPYEAFPGNIKACYTVWTRGQREKINSPTTHPDFEWTDFENGDAMIRRVGTLAGKTMREFRHYGCADAGNYFVKATPEVVARLESLHDDLVDHGVQTSTLQESVGKAAIVQIYTDKFGA